MLIKFIRKFTNLIFKPTQGATNIFQFKDFRRTDIESAKLPEPLLKKITNGEHGELLKIFINSHSKNTIAWFRGQSNIPTEIEYDHQSFRILENSEREQLYRFEDTTQINEIKIKRLTVIDEYSQSITLAVKAFDTSCALIGQANQSLYGKTDWESLENIALSHYRFKNSYVIWSKREKIGYWSNMAFKLAREYPELTIEEVFDESLIKQMLRVDDDLSNIIAEVVHAVNHFTFQHEEVLLQTKIECILTNIQKHQSDKTN